MFHHLGEPPEHSPMGSVLQHEAVSMRPLFCFMEKLARLRQQG